VISEPALERDVTKGESVRSPSLSHLVRREGLLLARKDRGLGSHVVGDPCVVWDEAAGAWRMILFYSPPGHGEALSFAADARPDAWGEPVPLTFTNPEQFRGDGTHTPFVALDPYRPNRPAMVDGSYWLYTVDQLGDGGEKRIHRARTSRAPGGKGSSWIRLPRRDTGRADTWAGCRSSRAPNTAG
jgi:hypothetical protein